MIQELKTNKGTIPLPNFFPDATRAGVKTIDSKDLEAIGVQGLVVNTYHVLNSHLSSTVKEFDGIGGFMNWNGLVLTDSGGFQVMSLIGENEKYGTITDEKVIFRNENGKKIILTPEKSIQLQLRMKSQIVMAFDQCSYPDSNYETQKKSVERTIQWAQQSKDEFEKLTRNNPEKPLLFGIIQGGNDPELRTQCAQALQHIGFDGYAYGGYPLDSDGNLLIDTLQLTADLMPDETVKYAMGVGNPSAIIECFKMGYRLFDCVIPTREARHKKLYMFTREVTASDMLENSNNFYTTLYYDNEKMIRDTQPISEHCDCHTCTHYSRAYLYNLFKIGDPLVFRLATIHNLRFYVQLMEKLQQL